MHALTASHAQDRLMCAHCLALHAQDHNAHDYYMHTISNNITCAGPDHVCTAHSSQADHPDTDLQALNQTRKAWCTKSSTQHTMVGTASALAHTRVIAHKLATHPQQSCVTCR